MTKPAATRRAAGASSRPRKQPAAPPDPDVSVPMIGRAALTTLTADQKDAITAWLEVQGLSVREASARLLPEYGIVANAEALAHWWLGRQFAQNVRASSQMATDLQNELESLPVTFDPGLLSRTSQAKFEAEITREIDFREHVALRRLQQTDRSQALAERSLKLRRAEARRHAVHSEQQLKLARDKFEFQAAEVALEHAEALRTIASDRSLPREEKLTAIRHRLFGAENDE